MGQKKIIGDLDVVGTITQNGSPIGGGGISIDTSGLFTLEAPSIFGIAFNAINVNEINPNFQPTLDLSSNPPSIVKCSMIILENSGYSVTSISGTLVAYDGTQITTSNLSSYFGKLLILKSDVTIRGTFN